MLLTKEDEINKILEITVDGKITRSSMEELTSIIESKARDWGKINVLEKYITLDTIEPGVIALDLKLFFKNHKLFRKVAIVTDKKWIKFLTDFSSPLYRFDVETFRSENLQEAKNWLMT